MVGRLYAVCEQLGSQEQLYGSLKALRENAELSMGKPLGSLEGEYEAHPKDLSIPVNIQGVEENRFGALESLLSQALPYFVLSSKEGVVIFSPFYDQRLVPVLQIIEGQQYQN